MDLEFDSGQSILFCMVSAGVNVCLILLDRDTDLLDIFKTSRLVAIMW